MGESSSCRKKSERASQWEEGLPTADSRGELSLPNGVSYLFLASSVPGTPWGQPRTLKKLGFLCSVRRTWSGHFAVSQCGTLPKAISSLSLDCFFIFILKIFSARQSVLEAQGGFLPSADFILSFLLCPFPSHCSTPSASTSFSHPSTNQAWPCLAS